MPPDLPLMAPVEEAVYLALQGGTRASHPSLTLSEVATATRLSESDVQQACRKLADLGLITIDGAMLSPVGARE